MKEVLRVEITGDGYKVEVFAVMYTHIVIAIAKRKALGKRSTDGERPIRRRGCDTARETQTQRHSGVYACAEAAVPGS